VIQLKCRYCKEEFSDSVVKLHENRCKDNPAEETKQDNDLEELRAKAKELGVENADRKGEKRLLEDIAAAETKE
jgi:hypothetical protein